MKGWARNRVQIDSGAMKTVGPMDVAREVTMKETIMSKKTIGSVAGTMSNLKYYGGTSVLGHTDSGEGLTMRIQCTDLKKILGW